jgi:erythromycin esterase-like protein
MKRPRPSLLAALAISSLVLGVRPQDEPVVSWLREQARPLRAGAEDAHEEWEFLDPAVRGARVVLLGEELHGVREFSELKHDIVRYLVEVHGFDTLALEQDSARGAALDRALRTSAGDPAAALERCYWCWNTAEFAALLAWLQDHNERAERPVAFVGIDNQGLGDAPERLRVLARSLAAADAFDPEPALALFPAGRDAYPKDDAAAVAEHARVLAELRAGVEGARVRLGPEPGADGLDAVRVLEEVFALWSAPDARVRMNRRDQHMAERTLALVRDPRRRVIVWAHNAHASRAVFYGGVEPLGKHVSAEVPTLVVGFYFGSGEVLLDPRARAKEGGATRTIAAPPEGSLARILAGVGGTAWAADLRDVQPTEVRRFFEAPPPGHFDNYGPPPALLGAIDFAVFVERVRPSSPAPARR